MNILLTSAGRRTYLVDFFKEALVKYNGKVHAINSHENAPALYHADFYSIAPPISSEQYISFLLEYCKAKAIKIIVPLLDLDLPVLAKAKPLFQTEGIYVLAPSEDIALLANDKYLTYLFLKDKGFDTVQNFLSLESFEEAHKLGKANFPVIIKPRWGMGSLFTYEAENSEELHFFYKKAKRQVINSHLSHESQQDPGQEILIMEKIDGEEYMLDIINDLEGNHKRTVVNKKLTRKLGETEAVVTVADSKLEKLGQEIASFLRHPLVCDVDVIVNAKGSYILEFNPRFSGGYPFSHLAGINLPLALIQWVNGEEVNESTTLIPEIGTHSMKAISMVKVRAMNLTTYN
ncbi:carbamoyl-phosphate synthase large subunit [Algoriphagus faecimaris]|uniref:Carbamoyl-phosphate synthase large subunit n=1 Tax=Algoriphagus faecimaris TaxID=686796 RepID=A0A1G6PTK9_9BACT|nr:ATP-grasp domain-containing protein [Algoriphagus faecimaris]SDC83560.1 carbamoyl-phosphate synthase large subunit [Algoriphagus faecimaris]